MSISSINNKELKELFNGLKQNDKSKFEILYKNYNRLVYKIAFSMLKNNEDSEDLVQIVFSKIYEMKIDKLPNDKESSWLYSVTKNEVINLLRKKKKCLDISSIYDIQIENDKIDSIVDKEWFYNLINKLDEKEREVISLKILSDLSFEEIAKILDKPTGTVKWRYYKSVNTLKILLSNLSMFILTFCMGLGLYAKGMEKKQIQIPIQNENIENTIKDNESHIQYIQDDDENQVNEENNEVTVTRSIYVG